MAYNELQPTEAHYGTEIIWLMEVTPKLVAANLAVADEPTSCCIVPARLQLQSDLYSAWGYDRETEEGQQQFEDRITLCVSELKTILAYKQIEMTYERFDQGEQSMTRYKYRRYAGLYNEQRARFPTLGYAEDRVTVKTVPMWR